MRSHAPSNVSGFCCPVQARDIIISPEMIRRTKRNSNVRKSPLSINDNDILMIV